MANETKKRSFIKSLVWRIIATLNGWIVTYWFTKNIFGSLKIAVVANITGFIMYYIHERVWNKIRWEKNV